MSDIITCFKCFCLREEVEFVNMHEEAERLKTYDTFMNQSVDPQLLSRNGFFYTGCSDNCVCAFCKVSFLKFTFHFLNNYFRFVTF